MSLESNASYIPTMNLFLAHWGQVNVELPAPLVIGTPDNAPMAIADFIALRTTLDGQFGQVINCLNDEEVARGNILIAKQQLLAYFNEFNGLLDGYYSSTAFANARAYAPNLMAGEENFLSPMRDTASLWDKMNFAPAPAGITLPLALADGTIASDFTDLITALRDLYAAEALAQQDAILARSKRDATKALAKAVMVAYRTVVPARCAQFPELVETLPRVSPLPGHTPAPVSASALFEAPDSSKVVYSASADAKLDHYELRGNPGGEYREEDAVVIANNLPSDPREFITPFGLTQPGAQVTLKVFVILTTGNESGSAAMTVTRPL